MGWLNVAVKDAGGSIVALLNTLIAMGFDFHDCAESATGINRIRNSIAFFIHKLF